MPSLAAARSLTATSLGLALLALAAAVPQTPLEVCPAGSLDCGMDSAEQDAAQMLQLRSKRGSSSDGVMQYLGGVPVYNYHWAHPSGASPSLLELGEKRDWIVFFDGNYADAQLEAVCAHKGGAECRFEGHPSEGGLPFIDVTATEEEVDKLMTDYPGIFIEPDREFELIPELPADENGGGSLLEQGAIPWGLDRTDDRAGLDGSYDIAAEAGQGVHVYVMDTGIRTTHQDFGGRAIPTLDVIQRTVDGPWHCQANETNCAIDRHGHGTHCAGSVGGSVYGIAKSATLHAVKVLSDRGSGSLAGIVRAIDLIAAFEAAPKVFSLSLGGPGRSESFKTAFDAAVGEGVTVVVAAGNSNTDACGFSPAYVPSAITVGSTTSIDDRSGFSNYGSCVDIFAPGSNIKSAGASSDTATAVMSGTSMACPHVAGAAAVLLSQGPNRTPLEITSLLVDGATPRAIDDVNQEGTPNKLLYLCNAPIPPLPTTTTTAPQ